MVANLINFIVKTDYSKFVNNNLQILELLGNPLHPLRKQIDFFIWYLANKKDLPLVVLKKD